MITIASLAMSSLSFATPLQGPQIAIEESKLLAVEHAENDWLGGAVAVSADTAVVGMYRDSDAGLESGSAHVYVRSGTSWVFQQELTASDAAQIHNFGWSVAISGDTVVVGARYAEGAAGAAYVFVRNGTTWAEEAKLTALDAQPGAHLGYSVAIHVDTIIAGARAADGVVEEEGAAYVFVRNGTTWIQEARLSAEGSREDDYFGHAVAIWGNTAVVGVPGDDDRGPQAGTAYVFTRSGANWTQQHRFAAPAAEHGDFFGRAVAVSVNTALIGAPLDDDAELNAGTVYVYRRVGSAWDIEQQLVASNPQDHAHFGDSLSMSEETAVIGAWGQDVLGRKSAGAVYLFKRSVATWNEQQMLFAPDAEARDYYGFSAAISGDAIVVGSPRDDAAGAESGSAHALILGDAATPLCFGDGSGAPCPCGNDSSMPGESCLHSGAVGMTISASGTTRIAADDLVITAAQCPLDNNGLFYCGTISLSPGAPLFDGLQCAGGIVRPFRALTQTAGSVSDSGFVAQAGTGYFVPGGTFHFQYWSRDANQSGPCSTGASFSPALAVTMSP